MPPFLLALCSSILVGTSDFTGGWSARRNSMLLTLLISQATGVIGLTILYLILGGHPVRSDYRWGVIGGFGLMGGRVLLYSALAKGRMSAAAPVASIFAIIVPILFDPVHLRPLAYLGIGLAALAIILIKHEENITPETSQRPLLPLLLAAMAGSCFGFFYVCLQHCHPTAGFSPILIAQGVSLLLAISYCCLIAARGTKILAQIEGWLLATVPGLTAVAGSMCILLAMQRSASLSVVTTLDALYPVTTVLLALIILKEKLRPVQGIGLAAAALAIILIAGFARAQ